MTQLAVILWLLNMGVDTGGQLAFKTAASKAVQHSGLQNWKHMLSRGWIWLGVCFYIAEFFIWLAFLSQVSLSSAMMLGSIDIVVIMLAGRLFFKEKFTPGRILGIGLITVGVAVVGMGE